MPTMSIPDKKCSKCNGIKYYHRVYKRISKATGKNYEHFECANCNVQSSKNWASNNQVKIKEIKNKSYLKYKQNPLRKKKTAENAKKYREVRKNTLEYKERIKKYSIKSFQILKDSLSDRYIKDRLVILAGKKVFDRNEIPQDLIELHRKQLLLKRQIKNNGKDQNNNNNHTDSNN